MARERLGSGKLVDHLTLPRSDHWTLTNVGLVKVDPHEKARIELSCISVKNGRFCDQPSATVIDAKGSLALPLFVDMHTHLDKGHIWPRSPNPDGTFSGALETVGHDRAKNWNARDVYERMTFALRCAYAHGTGAIRTHLDSASPQHKISWPTFARVRDEWSGRVDLQAVTILGIEAVDHSDEFIDIANTAAKYGGVLGCVTYPCPDLESRLRWFFNVAQERRMDVDFHTDETKDTNSNSLRLIAQLVQEMDFGPAVNVGHCCSLSQQEADTITDTLEQVAKANLSVVSLPMCNMYLQDRRRNQTPRWRGVTLVHEMAERGIRVSFASDNTRDPFYAYGDLDMVEVMREATRICHLDHSRQHWLESFSKTPAGICGFPEFSITTGHRADFILFKARNLSELLSRPQADRILIRNGKQTRRELPDYAELDYLMEVE